MNGIPSRVAHNLGQRDADREIQRSFNFDRDLSALTAIETSNAPEQKKEKARVSFYAKFMESMRKGKKGYNNSNMAYMFTMLGLNWLWKQKHNAKEAYVKAQMDMLKMEADRIKVSHFAEHLWIEKVKNTHDAQVRRAFYGYTSGAVKEISKLSNHAFWLDGVDTKISWDHKEIVSGLVNGHENAFSLRDLAEAYNQHFDNEENGWQALHDRKAYKSEFEKYGFDQKFSRKLDTTREHISLPELASLGTWLFAQKDGDGDKPDVGKNFAINNYAIADAKTYRNEWRTAIGFDEDDTDFVFGDRDLWQKWIMWHLKTPGFLQEGVFLKGGMKKDEDREKAIKNDIKYGKKALEQYQHSGDYYHRSLSFAVGGQIGRAQMDSRQKQSELLTAFMDSLTLTQKLHEEGLSTDENKQLNDADARIKQQIDLELEEENAIREIAEKWAEEYADKKNWDKDPSKRTDKQKKFLEYAVKSYVKKLQQKWAFEKKKRPVSDGKLDPDFEAFADSHLDDEDREDEDYYDDDIFDDFDNPFDEYDFYEDAGDE